MFVGCTELSELGVTVGSTEFRELGCAEDISIGIATDGMGLGPKENSTLGSPDCLLLGTVVVVR
jgi:hypothetical protein